MAIFTFNNPSGSSYFTLETVTTSSFYDASSLTNTLGVYSNFVNLSRVGLVTSSYISSVVVPNGTGSFTFDPTFSVFGTSSVYIRGTGEFTATVSTYSGSFTLTPAQMYGAGILNTFALTPIPAFQARVSADGGSYEAFECQNNVFANTPVNILQTASLLLTPNAYKEGKLYSIIPENGDGDFTFTRATTATRVNSDGLVELVPYNLLSYSEQFDNAAWLKTRATITANATTAPDGTSAADKMIANTDNLSHFIDQPITTTTNIPFTFSFFAKAGEYEFLQINNQVDNSIANFDLSNGTLGTISGYQASITDAGNGWYRCVATRTFSYPPSTHRIALITSATAARLESFTGNGVNGLYIWGAQIVEGSTALPYQKTETRLNIPRIDYSLGGCPSILLEPQRTNLFTYSEDFGAWAANAGGISSIEPNYAISPEGVENAYKVNFVVQGDSDLALVKGHSVTGGSTYAYSIYIKGEGSDIGKDIVVKSKRSSGDSAGTITTQTLTGEWVRVDFTTTYAANNTFANFYISSNDATSCLIYGAQAELGSYATSYIPTYGTSVTRNNDVCDKTSATALIGQTEGTVLIDIDLKLNNRFQTLWSLSDGISTSDFILVYHTDVNTLSARMRTVGVDQINISTATLPQGRYKLAMAYKENDVAFYVNGSLVGTDNSCAVPSPLNKISLTQIGTSVNVREGFTKGFALYKERLTDDQLEVLTGEGFNTYAEMASYYNYTLQ